MDKDFTLIPFRKINDSIDVDKLCLDNNIKLPILYKTFLETFILGEDNINRSTFFSIEFDDYFDCSAYIFSDKKEIGFIYFLDISEAIDLYKSGEYGADHFPIASCEGIGLTVCIKGEKSDKIYFEDSDGGGKIVVSKNIFEFYRGIENVELDERFLAGNVKYSELYRRFGYNYWEVIKTSPDT